MGTMASQITSLAIVYTAFYSGADQRQHRSSASVAFVRGIHREPGNSSHKWPVTREMYPFDDVIMYQNSLFIILFRTSHCHAIIMRKHEWVVNFFLKNKHHTLVSCHLIKLFFFLVLNQHHSQILLRCYVNFMTFQIIGNSTFYSTASSEQADQKKPWSASQPALCEGNQSVTGLLSRKHFLVVSIWKCKLQWCHNERDGV